MHIFLDESGGLGFSEKSQPYFVIAILITKDKKPIENCVKRVIGKAHYIAYSICQVRFITSCTV